jgi:hypothetical protein
VSHPRASTIFAKSCFRQNKQSAMLAPTMLVPRPPGERCETARSDASNHLKIRFLPQLPEDIDRTIHLEPTSMLVAVISTLSDPIGTVFPPATTVETSKSPMFPEQTATSHSDRSQVGSVALPVHECSQQSSQNKSLSFNTSSSTYHTY